MFRTALLSIVFSLAVGQNVALLCRAWCDAHLAAASECHHESSPQTPSVAGSENCDNVVGDATAVLREDALRDVSSRAASQAIPVLRYHLDQLTIDTRPGRQARREWPLAKRPLATALRI